MSWRQCSRHRLRRQQPWLPYPKYHRPRNSPPLIRKMFLQETLGKFLRKIIIQDMILRKFLQKTFWQMRMIQERIPKIFPERTPAAAFLRILLIPPLSTLSIPRRNSWKLRDSPGRILLTIQWFSLTIPQIFPRRPQKIPGRKSWKLRCSLRRFLLRIQRFPKTIPQKIPQRISWRLQRVLRRNS